MIRLHIPVVLIGLLTTATVGPPQPLIAEETIVIKQLREDAHASAEQLADLQILLKRADSHDVEGRVRFQNAYDRTVRAMKLPENESLAEELVRAAAAIHKTGTKPDQLENLLWLLRCRAGDPDRLRIDGPYLRGYAHLLATVIEEQLATEKNEGLSPLHPLLLYLVAHPEDKDLYDRTLRLAHKYAKVADLPPKPKGDSDSSWGHQSWAKVELAWVILFRLNVLKDGMRFDEAKAILGEPTTTVDYRGVVQCHWVVPTGFRLYTGMDAELRAGTLVFNFDGREG